MSRNAIVLSGDPKGHFGESTLASAVTPLPGTFVKQDSSGNVTPGGPAADGGAGPVMILREDYGRGRGLADAYEASGHCFWYEPIAGDQLMALVKNIAGTGDAFAIGAKLIIEASTGKLIATAGTPIHQFEVMDVTAALSADTLVRVRYLG